MDYEKTYKEALERAKEWKEKYGSIISPDGTMAKEFKEIFPQLAESEDERIRKWIYNMVENLGYPADEAAEKELKEMQPRALAYLDKQKERKPVKPDSYKNCNSQWKPSEEQMKQLNSAADLPEFGPMVTTRKQFPDLESLYEQLKKLM